MLPRSKPTARRPGDSSYFNSLPEDILILIFSHCRIDELLALRLTSSKARNIICSYMTTIAPCCARSTFPHSDLLLTPPDTPSEYTFDWLKRLIPKHLAAILVDRHRFSHNWAEQRYGIPAEDEYGSALRERVANGWRVLRRLSSISEEVYSLDAKHVLKSFAWKVVNPSRYKFEVFKQREDMILERRLAYIDKLSGELAKDYKLMFMLLSSAFRTSISNLGDDHKPWIFDWSCGIDGQRLLRRGNSWLTWFILHKGPILFWQQWWSFSPSHPDTKNHIRDCSIKAWFAHPCKITPEDFIRQFIPDKWTDVNQRFHDIQREHATKVQKAIEEKAAASSFDFAAVNPIMYFTQYAECRQLRQATGVPPTPEILSNVPFHIDFRCPEELFQKFCLVREEKAVAMAAQTAARV